MANVRYVNASEFASMQGVSRQYIQDLISKGVIPRTKLGIPLQRAQEAYDARPGTGGRRKKTASQAQATAGADGDEASKLYHFADLSKAKSQIYKSQLIELELKVKKGQLIPIEDVEADALAIGEELRGKLLAIPPRISTLCEGRSAREIEEIIEDAINNALMVLHKSKLAKGSDD